MVRHVEADEPSRFPVQLGDAPAPLVTPLTSCAAQRVKELFAIVLGGVEFRDGLAAEVFVRGICSSQRCLVRAIDHARAADLVGRNVAALISPPQGRAPGRQSKSLTVLQARHLVHSSKESRLHAYIVLCITTGIRTEEARALHWTEVDLARESIAVYRSVRARGDVKTPKFRRKLAIPELAVQALKHQAEQQAKDKVAAGPR